MKTTNANLIPKIVVASTVIFVLGLMNFSIWQKQEILNNGNIINLELMPVDPRSIMQGDYMDLRYEMSQQIRKALTAKQSDENEALSKSRDFGNSNRLLPSKYFAVVTLDDNRLAKFDRILDDSPLGEHEFILEFRVRNNRVQFATNAFFFAEGDEPVFRDAKYGQFRVNTEGELLLSKMLDMNFNVIEAPTRSFSTTDKS